MTNLAWEKKHLVLLDIKTGCYVVQIVDELSVRNSSVQQKKLSKEAVIVCSACKTDYVYERCWVAIIMLQVVLVLLTASHEAACLEQHVFLVKSESGTTHS